MRKFCVLGLLALVCALGLGLRANPAMDDKVTIQTLEEKYIKAFNAKDVNAIMAIYAPGDQLFVFDAVPPREYPSWDAYKKDWEGLFAAYPGPVTDTMQELSINVVGPVAYSHHIESVRFTQKEGTGVDMVIRVTDVFRKLNGKWLIVQEHVSFPVDLETGKADLLSKK